MCGGPDLRLRVGRGVYRDLSARQRGQFGEDAFRPRRTVDAMRREYLELRVAGLVRAARGDCRHFAVAGLAQQPPNVRTNRLGAGHVERACRIHKISLGVYVEENHLLHLAFRPAPRAVAGTPCLISILISVFQPLAAEPPCFAPTYHYTGPGMVAHRSISCAAQASWPVPASRAPELLAGRGEARRAGHHASQGRAMARLAKRS